MCLGGWDVVGGGEFLMFNVRPGGGYAVSSFVERLNHN
jgi:hypothetical protein